MIPYVSSYKYTCQMAGQGDTAADKGAKTVAARICTEQPAICFAGFFTKDTQENKGDLQIMLYYRSGRKRQEV